MARKYSSISTQTTLASGISNTATTMTVATGTGSALLGGVTLGASNVDQFTVAIDPDTASEEIVFITAVTSDTFTITRGRAGTSAITHSGGASVKHVLTGDDLTYFETSVSAATTATGTATLTNKTITLGTNTITGTTAQFNTALTDGNFATLAGTETLTNKTITAADNTLTGVATTAGTETLTNKTIALGSNTVSGTIAEFNTAVTDADLATIAGSETLTNKTLTSPTINFNQSAANYPTLKSPQEITTVSATAATGTIDFDAVTQGVLYYTSNASANWTLNIRGNSSTTLSSLMDVGDSITVVHLVTNGTTAYRNTAVQIDGSAVTPKWQGGSAPSAGNASSIDSYSYTVIKTASTPSYTVFASQTKFA